MKVLPFFAVFLLISPIFPVTNAGDVAPYTIQADKAWELGVTGKGVNIAILSTGIDNEHPGLEGKFIAGYDAVCYDDALCMASLQEDNGSFDPDDQDGGGTAVAAMATSTGLLFDGVQTNFLGSAPDANLIDVRVASRIGSSPYDNHIIEQEFYESAMDGLNWVIENKDTEWVGAESDSYGIDVMVVPFGITSHETGGSDGSDMFSQALDEAILAGIVVVVAAGNSGSDNDGLSSMAASSLAITVGAIDDKNSIDSSDDSLASYSSRGPRRDNNDGNSYDELKPDVVAPGTNIVQAVACVASGSCYNRIPGQNASDNGYSTRGGGTSYAAAYVAGVTALLLEANPELTPSEVKEIIQNSADRKETLSSADDGEGVEEGPWATYPELDSRWNRHFGYGIVNALAIDTTNPSAEFNWSYTNENGEQIMFAAMEGEPTHFDAGASSDNSNGPLTYIWDFGDGTYASGEIVIHTFYNITDEGFNVVLTVRDAVGNEDVTSYNIKPVQKERPDLFISSLTFSDDNPEEGDTVTMDAVVKLLGSSINQSFEVGFFLDTPDGDQIGSASVDGNNLSVGIEHSFNISASWKATSGTHTIYVVADSTDVIEESEEKNELSKVITVGFVQDINNPVPGTPTAIAGQDVSISPGGTVQFSGAGTDDDGTIIKYEWDFDGDGVYEWSSEENGITTFLFNNEGTYTATLRVTDNDGKTGIDSITITVSDAEEEGLLPSISLITSLILVGLLAIFRRK